MANGRKLTEKQRQALILEEAHGKAILLAVGIDDYDKHVGFPGLKTCSNDSEAIRNSFADVHQLNADANRLVLLTSKTKPTPSKGEILKALNRIVSSAESNDRLIFFFSGHGHRLSDLKGDERFYLVPQDAYSSEDLDALIDFDKVSSIIEKAEAKQKIIFLDACLSGPSIEGTKFVPAKYSKKFLADYMRRTKGFAVISSSSGDQASFTQSPNPKLSLFTHYCVNALNGAPEALDDSILTLHSLYDYVSTGVKRSAKSYQLEQFPNIDVKATGVIVLGNFSTSIIPPDQIDLEGYPIRNLSLIDHESFSVQDVLTNIKRWSAYSEEYLQGKVNDNLSQYLEDTFGKKASSLRKKMGFSINDVSVEGKCIYFPGGSYRAEYAAMDKKRGKLVYTLVFEQDWFSRSDSIPLIADILEMRPGKMVLQLSKTVNPLSLVPGLEARNWEVISHLQHKIEASQSGYTLLIEPDSISFTGFTLSEILGRTSEKHKAIITGNVLNLLV